MKNKNKIIIVGVALIILLSFIVLIVVNNKPEIELKVVEEYNLHCLDKFAEHYCKHEAIENKQLKFILLMKKDLIVLFILMKEKDI